MKTKRRKNKAATKADDEVATITLSGEAMRTATVLGDGDPQRGVIRALAMLPYTNTGESERARERIPDILKHDRYVVHHTHGSAAIYDLQTLCGHALAIFDEYVVIGGKVANVTEAQARSVIASFFNTSWESGLNEQQREAMESVANAPYDASTIGTGTSSITAVLAGEWLPVHIGAGVERLYSDVMYSLAFAAIETAVETAANRAGRKLSNKSRKNIRAFYAMLAERVALRTRDKWSAEWLIVKLRKGRPSTTKTRDFLSEYESLMATHRGKPGAAKQEMMKRHGIANIEALNKRIQRAREKMK